MEVSFVVYVIACTETFEAMVVELFAIVSNHDT